VIVSGCGRFAARAERKRSVFTVSDRRSVCEGCVSDRIERPEPSRRVARLLPEGAGGRADQRQGSDRTVSRTARR